MTEAQLMHLGHPTMHHELHGETGGPRCPISMQEKLLLMKKHLVISGELEWPIWTPCSNVQLRKSQIGKEAGIEWGRGQKSLETDEDLPPVKLLV